MVEVVWYGDLSRHEPQSLHLVVSRGGQRGDLDDWFALLGNDEGLALGRRLHQFRELRLGFVNVDNFHGFKGDVMLSLTSGLCASRAYLEWVEHRDT